MSTGSEMMITPSIFYLSVLSWYGDSASTQLRRTFHNPNVVLVTFRLRHVAKAKCILVTGCDQYTFCLGYMPHGGAVVYR